MCHTHLHIVTFFFFNDTATTEIYTLSLHDALPICTPPRRSATWARPGPRRPPPRGRPEGKPGRRPPPRARHRDRKSTRLNSSHLVISYAVFCLKKKNNNKTLYSMTHTIYIKTSVTL